MKDTIVIVFEYERGGHTLDIEVPKNLTANELIFGLNEGLKLGIDVSNPKKNYLVTHNPRLLVRGAKTLEELLGFEMVRLLYMVIDDRGGICRKNLKKSSRFDRKYWIIAEQSSTMRCR